MQHTLKVYGSFYMRKPFTDRFEYPFNVLNQNHLLIHNSEASVDLFQPHLNNLLKTGNLWIRK